MQVSRPLFDLDFPERGDAFRATIRALSTAAAGPHADNFLSNEDAFPRVAGELARRVPKGGVYLGVGPDQNFTMLAHAEPVLSFVIDHRRRNLRLHLLHKALFSLAPDRASYLGTLTARRLEGLGADPDASALIAAGEAAEFDRARLDAAIVEVARALRPLGVLEESEWDDLATIQTRLAGPGLRARFLALPMYPTFGKLIGTRDREGQPAHVLSRETLYQRVRQAQREDRIIPVVGDFAGPETLPRLGNWLSQRGLSVGLLYISDVEFFLLRQGRFASYASNLDRLPWKDGALVVRTSTREINHPERVPGDSSTTVVRAVAPFLAAARAGKIGSVDDLFAPSPC